jgi:UDP-galactopyranose mutase
MSLAIVSDAERSRWQQGFYVFDWLIAGAGFSGSVLAERLASQRGDSVLIVDRRNHIGGNAYDRYDDAGVLIHEYGPHIFHTNSKLVFDYLSCFTDWRPYEHRVLASLDGRLLPFPINRTTLNQLYGVDLNDAREAEQFLQGRAEAIADIRTSEDVVLSKVGRDLYETFFRGYTRKQWGLDPADLDKSVAARVPARHSTDDRYFEDKYQAMPTHGYTRLFERMLDHRKIKVQLGCEFAEARAQIPHRRVIFTGPIDEYFGHALGKLPYRSITFRRETLDTEWAQPVAVVNYPGSEPYTRVTEFKHLTGQAHPQTSLAYEFPTATGDPYYPIPRPENRTLYRRYEQLARSTENVFFSGRLVTYMYYNMDQVVAQSLALFERLNEPSGAGLTPRNA